jgi:hypothetical protein
MLLGGNLGDAMREQGFKLTPSGSCENPRCSAPLYAELMPAPVASFLLCVECEDEHGAGVRASAVLADLFTRSGGRLPPPSEFRV